LRSRTICDAATVREQLDETAAQLVPASRFVADPVGHSQGAFVAMLVAKPRAGESTRADKWRVQQGRRRGAGREWDIDAIAQFLGPADAEVSPDGADHFRLSTRVTA